MTATRPPVKGDSVELVEDLTREIDNMDLLQVDCGLTERQLRDIRAHITALSERVVVLEGVLTALVEKHVLRGPFDEPLGSSEQSPEINASIAALKGCDALGGGL